MNVKQGDWIITDNGLGTPTFVFLKKDEGCGLFSAWFYNPNFGLDCADWAVFSLLHYPHSRLLTKQEVCSLDKELLEAVL